MRTLKYLLEYDVKHKSIVHQLDFIGELLQAKVKNRLFVNLESRRADYFPEYSSYLGRALIIFKSMYGMTNSGQLFSDGLKECFLEAGFIQSQCQMYIYQKYAPYERNIVLLYYVDDCVYWYTYEYLGKGFVYTLGKRFHVKFLGYVHWFM